MLFYPHVKLEQGVGIEPTLGPHLGHTGYKSVGTSSYTNLAYFKFGAPGGIRTPNQPVMSRLL